MFLWSTNNTLPTLFLDALQCHNHSIWFTRKIWFDLKIFSNLHIPLIICSLSFLKAFYFALSFCQVYCFYASMCPLFESLIKDPWFEIGIINHPPKHFYLLPIIFVNLCVPDFQGEFWENIHIWVHISVRPSVGRDI